MAQDYTQLIQDVIQPMLIETVWRKPYDAFVSLFTNDTAGAALGGSKIEFPMRVATSTNASAYTRADVNPDAGGFTVVYPYWNRNYYHTAVEVHGLDEAEVKDGGYVAVSNLIGDAIAHEMPNLMQVIFNAMYAQLKSDIDATGAFSDNSLSRTTYPTLASYEEATDTAITLAIIRTAVNAVHLNKDTPSYQNYTWGMEPAVYNVFNPLAAAVHTWNINDAQAGAIVDTGYQYTGNFEGTPVAVIEGATTGDAFYFVKEDVKVQTHMPLQIEQVPSGKHSAKFVIRIGANLYCQNPGRQGKLTDKD